MEAEREKIEGPGAVELAPDEELEIISFGELKEGDVILGSSGRATVVQGFDPHIPKSMYVIETDSGIELELSGNHLLYVVTANDRDLHRLRLSEGKRLGKTISAPSLEILEDLAQSTDGKHGMIAEFENFIEPKSPELWATLVRVAESLGPVSESNLLVDDLGGREEPLYESAIQNYDRRDFARQLLSVLNIGRARKLWPVVVGTVMPVESLLTHSPEDIYIPDPPEVLEENR